MSQTTFEEAKLCPKCGIPGQETSIIVPTNRTVAPGTKVYVFICRNDVCSLANQNWLVQVNPDGSIPPKGRREDKMYPDLNLSSDEKMVVDRLQRELDQSRTDKGGELYRS